jgi:hypothetical protein
MEENTKGTLMSNPVQIAVGRLAEAQRVRPNRPLDPQRVADARNELVAAKTERAIREALRPDAPYEPLRAEDRERLATLLLEG